ncbi:hypothetical protein EGW08_000481 [Elysia chlorotica]|uniref:G-protein coupled receptors family 2 profile 2 domain-containing protein n=1 Tax=Elysia chlorotica TaxID=188477 RepID=A0A433UDI0_ELYCH|nr:hypothetical protein EGW08_000481 [Elysia chlorotica]
MARFQAVAISFMLVLLPTIAMCLAKYNTFLEHGLDNWKYLHVLHCGLVCHNGVIVRLYSENECEDPNCFQCDCDPTCAELDTCCPQAVDVVPNRTLILSEGEPQPPPTIPPYHEQIKCDGIPYIFTPYLQVASCPPFIPPEHDSGEIRQLCEEEPDDDTSVETIIPYVDVRTGLILKNKYCAICNGYTLNTDTGANLESKSISVSVKNIARVANPWVIKVNCSHFQNLYTYKSLRRLFTKAIGRSTSCQVYYDEAPSARQPTLCYRNPPEKYDRLDCGEPTRSLCRELNNTVFFQQSECQPALCPAGKDIQENGTCKSAIDQIRGLGYHLFVVFHAVNAQKVTPQDVRTLSHKIHDFIVSISIESMTDINITVVHDAFDMTYTTLERISISSHLVGMDSMTRDEYEDRLLSFFSGEWIMTVSEETNNSFQMASVLMGKELKEIEQRYNKDVEAVVEIPPLSKSIESLFLNNFSMNTDIQESLVTPRTRKSMFTQSHTTRLDHDYLWALKARFIDVTHSLRCPYVLANISNTNATVEKIPTISVSLMGQTVKVSTKQKLAVVDGQVQLCLSLYNKLIGLILNQNRQSLFERVHFYLEVGCVCLSVTCLLLSILTYCVFPALRTLPGMNNLSLCVSLAVAQTSLLVTARWGVNKQLPQSYCLAHAMLLHYAWLASFAWMSVCCIHMFRVFTAHTNRFMDNRSDNKRYLLYCVYGFGMPSLIVVATYAINACLTQGGSNGYNDEVCFFETGQSIWTLALSLMAPLCALILTNGVMFVLTIREIVQVTTLQEHSPSRDRQGVITYVKLSTLTGLLGALVVVAAQLNSSVLSLLTSPLMALQGLFIFASFTCNRRVRQLYLDLLRQLGLRCGKSDEQTTQTGLTYVGTSITKT